MTCFLSLPGVDSPDETGEVARVSATKGGRAVEPAALCSQRRFIKQVDSSVGYFAALNMTCFLSPIGTSCHFPRFLSPIVGVADTSPEGGSKVDSRKTLPRRRKQKALPVDYSPKMRRATNTPLADACDKECVTPLPSPMI